MTTSQDVAVTYTGTDNPFKDRIYRSGLTFTPGQTRLVPITLAQRFLRHKDVFKEGAAEAQAEATTQAVTQAAQQAADQSKPQDDTQAILEQQKLQEDTQRQQEDARFALMDTIDSMDRKAVMDWAEQHYKQKIPGNLSVEKARVIAKGFIDQYGMPA